MRVSSSEIAWSITSATLGASFTGLTVSMKLVVSVSSPSETITTISDSPYQSAAGVTVIVLSSEFVVTVRSLTLEEAERVNTSPVSISVSSMVNVVGISSSMTSSDFSAIIGASFTGVMINSTLAVNVFTL